MQVANADALTQREKRAQDEKQNLITQKNTLRRIFAGCVLSSALVIGSCLGDITKQANAQTPNQQTTERHISAHKHTGKGVLMIGFLMGGILSLGGMANVNRRIRSVECRQRILAFKG